MTPEEDVLLQKFGVTVMFNLMSVGLYAFGYASFVWLYILASRLLLVHGVKTTAQKTMLGLANVLCILCTLDIVTEIWLSVMTLSKVLTNNSSMALSLSNRIEIASKLTGSMSLSLLEDAPLRIIVLIGDVTVVWRAWVMWPDSQLVKSCLILAMLTSIALNLAYLIEGVTVMFDLVGCLSSFVVNTVGTALVFRKAWLHRKFVGGARKKTDVQRMLALIVESGSIYGFLQLAYLSVLIILFQLPAPEQSSAVVLVLKMVAKVIADFAPAAYPLAVIVIIRLRRSIVEETVSGLPRSSGQVFTSALPTMEFVEGATSSSSGSQQSDMVHSVVCED